MTKKGWLIIGLVIFILMACDDFADDFDDEFVDDFDSLEEEPDNFDEDVDLSSDDEQTINSEGCPFEIPAGHTLTCGFLTVPENRTLTGSPTIEIAYAIVHAPEPDGTAPIVYLAGGPGGSGIDDFVADPAGWQYPFTRTRDLILVDQRGTGFSRPTLDCPELAEEVEFNDENPERVCHARLVAEGIDLTAYNTAENAADIEALRTELNIEQWDLLGISYGTRLALNIMRDYPEGIGAVILDSVFPPNADTPGDEAIVPYRSLQRLFAECASNSFCNSTYPNLESIFIETVIELNDSPVDGVFGDDLLFSITNALNDTEQIPWLPYTIYEVADGHVDELEELSGIWTPLFQAEADRSDSEGMYNSVICHDEYAFGDYATAEARAIDIIPEPLEAGLLQPVADLFQVCSFWGAGTADAIENEAVFSDIPTLILAGQYDHATPPEWAALTAQTLENAFVFEIPGAGHALLSGHTCAIEISTDFLNNPVQSPAATCIDDIIWPNFE